MNIDIDTQQAAPALTITDDKHLSDIVFQIASRQLLINGAEADMQARVEAAKKAFADSTEPLATEIKDLFAAVEAYANRHKDRLFPLKGGKRKKTFPVLAHKLQYRSSDQVKAPANAAEIVQRLAAAQADPVMHALLMSLLRTPAPELDKEKVKAVHDAPGHPTRAEAMNLLAAHGISTVTQETFKLAFAFTPDQAKS